MKIATISADASLDALQQLAIFQQRLNAVAASLERYGLRPGDGTQLQDYAAGLERVNIYDIPLAGYDNSGHDFGDALSERERRAVLEYLKSL